MCETSSQIFAAYDTVVIGKSAGYLVGIKKWYGAGVVWIDSGNTAAEPPSPFHRKYVAIW